MGNRVSKVYTRTGDKGTTGLGDGTRVPKDSLRVTAYGTTDELNCTLGMVLSCEGVGDDVRAVADRIDDGGQQVGLLGVRGGR